MYLNMSCYSAVAMDAHRYVCGMLRAYVELLHMFANVASHCHALSA